MAPDRKPRFILVEPSALHTGGHHYEYATRILGVARDKGFDTELWANRKAQLPDDNFHVLPLFQQSYYQNFHSLISLPVLRAFNVRKAKDRITAAVRQWIGQRFISFVTSNKLGLHIMRAAHDAGQRQYRPVYDGPQQAVKTPALFYTALFGLFVIRSQCRSLLRLRAVKFAGYALLGLVLLFLSPLFILGGVGISLFVAYKVLQPKSHRVFAADLAKGLRERNDWSPQDIIFIPTAFRTEIRAFGDFFTNWPEDKTLPQFHLLFRANIFNGYTYTHRSQMTKHLDFRQSFKWLTSWHEKKILHYYTDTPQLAAQYKVLTDCEFNVLPVPVPWTPEEPATREGPVNIAYVGDVRDEKGYHFYPSVIQSLWKHYIDTGRIHFTMQSNVADNPAACPEASIAQAYMRSLPPSIITHVPGPLDSAAYRKLISGADIILINYEPEAYMARSSGIFIEALKAGKPALIPARTWMASLVETMRQEKWREAAKDAKLSQTLESNDWHSGQDIQIKLPQARWAIATLAVQANGENDLFIELTGTCHENGQIVARKTRMALADKQGRCTVLLTFPEHNGTVELRYTVHGGDSRMKSADIRASADAWQGAEDFAAAVYATQEEGQIAAALSELIDHLPEYQKDVQKFVAAQGAEFTPHTLVQRLIDNASMAIQSERRAA